MLYLIQRKDGSLDHVWSNKDGADFVDVIVIGEALKDESGKYVDVKCVEIINGAPVINAAKKAELRQSLEAEKAQKIARQRQRELDLEALRGKDLSGVEVKKAVEIFIAKYLGD